MLRIYIHDEVPVTSFVLEGKLVGPWVEELEKGWKIALAANPSRRIPELYAQLKQTPAIS
jgi:hypothetical protein